MKFASIAAATLALSAATARAATTVTFEDLSAPSAVNSYGGPVSDNGLTVTSGSDQDGIINGAIAPPAWARTTVLSTFTAEAIKHFTGLRSPRPAARRLIC